MACGSCGKRQTIIKQAVMRAINSGQIVQPLKRLGVVASSAVRDAQRVMTPLGLRKR